MIRIGLTQYVDVLNDKSARKDCLDQAWTHLIVEYGMMPIPLPNCIEDAAMIVSELRLDGLVLTGGNDLSHMDKAICPAIERDKFEHKLLDVCAKKDIPVLGVCRGMQVLGTHYGSELVAVGGHVTNGHPLVVDNSARMPLGGYNEVNSFHHYGFLKDSVGSELIIVASATGNVVEAVVHKKSRQWGIMWHPERAPRNDKNAIVFKTLFNP